MLQRASKHVPVEDAAESFAADQRFPTKIAAFTHQRAIALATDAAPQSIVDHPDHEAGTASPVHPSSGRAARLPGKQALGLPVHVGSQTPPLPEEQQCAQTENLWQHEEYSGAAAGA